MKTVLYASPFVPAEWIVAHGLRPCLLGEMEPGRRRIGPAAMGACHFAETLLHFARFAEGTIFVSACDQMRRAADDAASRYGERVFLMNVPATWRSAAARQLYREEIVRLGAFLVRLGGGVPTGEALAAVLRGKASGESILPGGGGVPLAIVGESLLGGFVGLKGFLEKRGGRIALDATANGERGCPLEFDGSRIGTDPLGALADAYFDGVADTFQRPNGRLLDWLRPRLAERGIRGIILWHYGWCDLWRAEGSRLGDETGLPVLHLDAGDAETLTPSMGTRIEAFMEILRR